MRKYLALLACAALLFSSCGAEISDKETDSEPAKSKSDTASAAAEYGEEEAVYANVDADIGEGEENETEGRPTSGTAEAHLLCVGDNLIHDNIYNEALKLGGGTTYDFSSMYEEIRPYVERADVAILNQETLVNDLYEAQSFPMFSTPTENGDATVDLGFNVVSMSNNHVLDKGAEGLKNSLDYWDSKGVVHYGAYRDEADSKDIRTMEVNGITFAFLGYMEHTNGIYLDGGDGKVVYLSDTLTIEQQVRKADEIADVVVVSCHYGTEVVHDLNQQQIDLTPQLVEWGADLIIGTQAHCVSTCEYLDKPDGGQAFVYYGLGNFFHTMYDYHSAVGIMGDLDVKLDYATGEVTFENVKAIPVVSHYEADYFDGPWYNCKVYPLAEYTDELFARNFNEGVNRSIVMDCLSVIPDEYLAIE